MKGNAAIAKLLCTLCDGEISAKMTQHMGEEEAKVFINDYFFDAIDG